MLDVSWLIEMKKMMRESFLDWENSHIHINSLLPKEMENDTKKIYSVIHIYCTRTHNRDNHNNNNVGIRKHVMFAIYWHSILVNISAA